MDFETSLLATGGEDRGDIQVSTLRQWALRDSGLLRDYKIKGNRCLTWKDWRLTCSTLGMTGTPAPPLGTLAYTLDSSSNIGALMGSSLMAT